MLEPGRPGSGHLDTDEAIDNALAAETRRTAGELRTADLPLKRQWDAELEAELEAVLSGFDPKTFRGGRAPPGNRDGASTVRDTRPGRDPGPRTGKVISVRGKSLFVDLGGKSEGVIPLDQFEGENSRTGSTDRGRRRSLRP